ncbi:MAG: hypothetical protein ABI550_08835 [Ignavibacteriaceae bacterium]
MISYINIGVEKKNLSGIGSRGYNINRRNKDVIIKYGAIEVFGRMGKRIVWAKGEPHIVEKNFKTIKEADKYKRHQIKKRISHGYESIPARIYKFK